MTSSLLDALDATVVPGRVLAVSDDEVWTQERFDGAVRGIAGVLARGDGPVAILTTEPMSFYLGMFACLRSGRTAVPLRAADPRARLAGIVDSSGATQILVDGGGERLGLPAVDVRIASHLRGGPPEASDPEGPAIIVHTSGSTGRPKGVVMSHDVLLHRTRNLVRATGMTADDRVLALSQYVMDSIAAHLTGGSFHPASFATGATAVVRRVTAEGVTMFRAPTPVLRALAEARAAGDSEHRLRLLLQAGDLLQRSDVHRLLEAFPGVVVGNGYGTTETGIITVTTFDAATIDGTDDVGGLPVGAIVDDRRLELVPVEGRDGLGEVTLTGPGIARYHRTEDEVGRFEPSGSDDPSVRRFRTGDLGRLDCGVLRVAGRVDRLVKVAGMRVEPAEVEAVLAAAPGVVECVVEPLKRGSGHLELVAYVRGDEVDTVAVRRHLAEHLPAALIPSRWVSVDTFATMGHGKIDRSALPAPVEVPTAQVMVPDDEDEAELAGIWEHVLERPVDMTTSFFSLGGTSFDAVRMLGEVELRLGVALPIGTLVTTDTVRELAVLIRRARTGDVALVDGDLMVLRAGRGDGPTWVCMGLPNWRGLTYGSLARSAPQDVTVVDVTSPRYDEDTVHRWSVPAVVDTAARAVVDQVGGTRVLVGFSGGGAIAAEVAAVLAADGDPVALTVLLDAGYPSAVGPRTLGQKLRHPRQGYRAAARSAFVSAGRRLRPDATPPQAPVPRPRRAADRDAVAHHRLGRIPGPVLFVGASENRSWRRTASAWETHVDGDFTSIELPGGHHGAAGMIQANAHLVAEAIAAAVDGATASAR